MTIRINGAVLRASAATALAAHQRIRSLMCTAAVAIVAATATLTLTVPDLVAASSPTPAAAANEINGRVWKDVDADGVNDPSEPGLNGMTVTLFNAANVQVGQTTTPASGLYSFSGLSAADGPFRVTIVRDATVWPDPSNWTISAAPFPGYTGADQDFILTGAAIPTGQAAGIAPGQSVDAAIRPRVELGLGFFGPGQIDGSGPFNTTGTCASPTASAPPGDDCGDSNGQLRTGDTLTTIWSVTADNFEPGTSSWGDVYFDQVITPTAGAIVTFSQIPASCLAPPQGTGGTGSPASAILLNTPAAGQTTLRCNLGPFAEGQQESVTTSMKLSALSPNGSSFSTGERVYMQGDRAIPQTGPSVGPIIGSARPAYDLVKLPFRNADQQIQCIDTDGVPATPCENLNGYNTYFLIRITQEQKVGVEAIQQPIVMNDILTANKADGVTPYPGFEFYFLGCLPNPTTGWGDAVFGADTINASPTYAWPTEHVANSGTCTRTRSTPTDNTSQYSLSISGADLSATRFPTRTIGGQDLTAGPFIDIEQRVQVFIPFRTIDAADGTVNGNGQIQLSNKLGGFDPTSASGGSNYGAGVEPGYCTADGTSCDLMSNGSRSNNAVGPTTFTLSTTGAMSKYEVYRVDNWSSWTTSPGAATGHDGAGMIEASDYAAGMVSFQNNGGAALVNPGVCDVFDNTVFQLATADHVRIAGAISLTPAIAAATYAYISRYNGLDGSYSSVFSQAWPANWRVEYAHVPVVGDDPLYNAARVAASGVIDSTIYPGVDTYSTSTGRFEGVWSGQKAARCNDASAPDGWFTTPASVPGGIDAINAVRAVPVDPTFSMPPSGYARLLVPMKIRDTFSGGPHTGEAIPAGTVDANYGLVKADNVAFNGGGSAGQWRNPAYVPSPLFNAGDGDRVTLVRFSTRIQKHTISPATAVGATTSVIAGTPIVWEMIPAVQTTLVPSTQIAGNVRVIDVLPPNTTYNAACTTALNNTPSTVTILPALVEANTGLNGAQVGSTRLTYQLGDLPVNVAIPPIRVCTDTNALAPNGTAVTNYSEVRADGDITSLTMRSDDHTIQLTQVGSIQIAKSVDRSQDPINDTQVYTVEYANFASAFTISPPTIIDVFPWNGDGAGSPSERDPASGFHGTLTLTAAPAATFRNGSMPGVADPTPTVGTFAYTKDAASTIDYNPDANTSKWCTTPDGAAWTPTGTATAADCPTSFAQVTAFQFVSAYRLAVDGNPRQGQKLVFTLQANGNHGDDHYTNRVTFDSASLPAAQYLRSNNVTVTIPSFNLGDLVFGDVNRNGRYDAGDIVPPAGVPVQLFRAGDTVPYRTTATNAAGRYQFTGLDNGDYFVQIPATEFAPGGRLAPWALLTAGLAADPNNDINDTADHNAVGVTAGSTSNGVRSAGLVHLSMTVPANPATPVTGDEPLGDNTGLLPAAVGDDFTNYTLDLGLMPQVSIGDHVFLDTNRDGVQNAAEPAVDGVAVALYAFGADPAVDTPIASTVTASGGLYVFTGLAPSTAYLIVFTPPTGRSFTLRDVSTNGGTDATDSDVDQFGHVVVTSPATPPGINRPAGDDVSVDAGLVADDLTLTKSTTSTGPYYERSTVRFTLTPHNNGPTDAPAGWSVTDVLPAGFTAASVTGSAPASGYTSCTLATLTCTNGTALAHGADGEPIVVTATVDNDVVGDLHNVAYISPSATDIAELIPLAIPTTSTDTAATITNNDAQATVTVASLVSIGDRVWLDVDRDGTQDVGEPGKVGVTVELLDGAGRSIDPDGAGPLSQTLTNTGSGGFYFFDDLTPGTPYEVKVTAPPTYGFTVQTAFAATAASDSDANPATGVASVIAPSAGSNGTTAGTVDDGTIDAGLTHVDLTLAKVLITAGNYWPGKRVTYSLTAANLGSTDALPGWSVTDVPPAGLTNVSLAGAGYICVALTCTSDTAIPAGGHAAPVTVTATVAAGTTGLVRNVAYTSPVAGEVTEVVVLGTPPAAGADTTGGTNNDSHADLTSDVYDLALAKTADTSVAKLGEAITYTITIANQGTVDSGGYTVTDLVPAGLTVDTASISDGGAWNQTDRTIRWALADLAAADPDNTRTVTYRAAVTDVGGHPWRNIAEITADSGSAWGGDIDSTPGTTGTTDDNYNLAGVDNTDIAGAGVGPDTSDDEDIADVTTGDRYDLALAKTVAVTGSGENTTIGYSITVANQGTLDSGRYTVVDVVPKGLTAKPGSVSDGGVFDAVAGTITWSLGSLTAGANTTITWSATVTDFSQRPYRNFAQITQDGSAGFALSDADSTPGDGSPTRGVDNIGIDAIDHAGAGGDAGFDDEDIADTDVAIVYDLALVKQASATSIEPDGTVTFTLTVKNQGDVNSGAYSVTDSLPAGVAATVASDGGSISPTTVTWHLADLAPGAARSVTVAVRIVDVTQRPFENIAEISADGARGYDSTAGTAPDVHDTDSTPDSISTNDNGTVRTDGYGTDESPANDLTDIAELDAVEPIANGEDDADVAFFDTHVLYDLALVKTGPATIDGNAPATFTITVLNQGNVPSGQFTVTDTLPPGLGATAASNSGTISGRFVIWKLGGLNPHQSMTVTVTVTVTDFTTRPWTNVAEVSADSSATYSSNGYQNASAGIVRDDDSTPDTDPTNDVVVDQTSLPSIQHNDPAADSDDQDIATINANVVYDLALITALAANVAEQQASTVAFVIEVKNQGNVDSGAFTVHDVLPPGLSYASSSLVATVDGQIVTWTIANLRPGDIATITIVVNIDDRTKLSYINLAEIVTDGAHDYDAPGSVVRDKDSTPDADISNDPLVDTDDVNIDNIPGDEDDHDRAVLDPALVRLPSAPISPLPVTGINVQRIVTDSALVASLGSMLVIFARRRQRRPRRR